MQPLNIYCNEPPAFWVDEGMAHIEYRSGEVSFRCVLSMHVFARALADANKLFAMWEAEQSGRFVQEFPARNRARRGGGGGPDGHAA